MARVKFYLKGSGRSPVEEFLRNCSQDVKEEFIEALVLLELGKSLSMPLSRNLSSMYRGLHELRLKDSAGQYRFFYFIRKGDAVYFVHAIMKTTQELPKLELELVLKRIKEI